MNRNICDVIYDKIWELKNNDVIGDIGKIEHMHWLENFHLIQSPHIDFFVNHLQRIRYYQTTINFINGEMSVEERISELPISKRNESILGVVVVRNNCSDRHYLSNYTKLDPQTTRICSH